MIQTPWGPVETPMQIMPYFNCPHCGEVYKPKNCQHDKERVPPDWMRQYALWLRGELRIPAVSELYLKFEWLKHHSTIFSDGFESNNFTAWTNTETSGGATIATSSEEAKEDTYSAKSIVTGQNIAKCYKTITATAEIWSRFYIKVTAMAITSNWNYWTFWGVKSDTTYKGRVTVRRRSDGTRRWYLPAQTPFAEGENTSVLFPSVPTGWICVEHHWESAVAGLNELYVDGVQLISKTANNASQTVNEAGCGILDSSIATGTDAVTLYQDSHVWDNASQVGCISGASDFSNLSLTASILRSTLSSLPISLTIKRSESAELPFETTVRKTVFSNLSIQLTVPGSTFSNLPITTTVSRTTSSTLPISITISKQSFAILPIVVTSRRSTTSTLPIRLSVNLSLANSLPIQLTVRRSELSNLPITLNVSRRTFNNLPFSVSVGLEASFNLSNVVTVQRSERNSLSFSITVGTEEVEIPWWLRYPTVAREPVPKKIRRKERIAVLSYFSVSLLTTTKFIGRYRLTLIEETKGSFDFLTTSKELFTYRPNVLLSLEREEKTRYLVSFVKTTDILALITAIVTYKTFFAGETDGLFGTEKIVAKELVLLLERDEKIEFVPSCDVIPGTKVVDEIDGKIFSFPYRKKEETTVEANFKIHLLTETQQRGNYIELG